MKQVFLNYLKIFSKLYANSVNGELLLKHFSIYVRTYLVEKQRANIRFQK